MPRLCHHQQDVGAIISGAVPRGTSPAVPVPLPARGAGCLCLLALSTGPPPAALAMQIPQLSSRTDEPFPRKNKKRLLYVAEKPDCDNVASAGLGYFILARSLCKFKQQRTGSGLVAGSGISGALFSQQSPLCQRAACELWPRSRHARLRPYRPRIRFTRQGVKLGRNSGPGARTREGTPGSAAASLQERGAAAASLYPEYCC